MASVYSPLRVLPNTASAAAPNRPRVKVLGSGTLAKLLSITIAVGGSGGELSLKALPATVATNGSEVPYDAAAPDDKAAP